MVLLWPPSLAYPPMYPSVRGSTLKVHGDRLVKSPAANVMANVAAETPVPHGIRCLIVTSWGQACLNRAMMHRSGSI